MNTFFSDFNSSSVKPAYDIKTDPNAMIPLLPGESYHLGYEPIGEELAFDPPYIIFELPFVTNSMFKPKFPIRIPRGRISHERLVMLIHKFISCTRGATRLVPKNPMATEREMLVAPMPRKSLYYANIRYCMTYGETAYITIQMHGIKVDAREYLQVTTTVTRGLGMVEGLFLKNLTDFLESDGTVFNVVTGHELSGIMAQEDDELDNEINGDAARIFIKPSEQQAYAQSSFSFDAPASHLLKISDLLPSFTSHSKSVNPIVSDPPKPPKLSLIMPEPEPEPALLMPALVRTTNADHDCKMDSTFYTIQKYQTDIDSLFTISGESYGKSINVLDIIR